MKPATARSTAGVRRQEILRVASHEFALTGLHGTSTETIARAAGVSQPYLFRLFGTKKALFLATVDRACNRLSEVFAAAAAEAVAAGRHPMHDMGERYIELLDDRDQILLQMQSYVACDDDDVRALVQGHYGRLYSWLETLPGCDHATVHQFVSTGMLLNVAAAMNLREIAARQPWAARCLDVPEACPDPVAPQSGPET